MEIERIVSHVDKDKWISKKVVFEINPEDCFNFKTDAIDDPEMADEFLI